MKKLLFLIGTMLTIALQAQQIFAPEVKWQFTKNDSITEATKVVETDNHNFVLLYENKFSSQAFLEEIDSTGNVFWNKNIGLSAKDQQYGLGYYDFKKTSDGYIACGGYPGSSLLVVVTKTNKTGDIMWNKYYLDDNYSNSYAFSIDIVGDSSYIVSGSKELSGHSNSFLMKIDTAGTKLWWKNYYLNTNAAEILDPKVITLSNGFGQLVICGLDNAPYGSEYFLRTNETGDSVYSYNFPLNFHPTSFTKSNYDQSFMFVTQNWDNSGNFSQNFSTFKLDSNGLFLSQKNFSWPGYNGLPPEIMARNDSGFVVLNTDRSIVFGCTYYIRINENGDTLGLKKIGGISGNSYSTTCFVPTADGNCVIVGPEKDSIYNCPDERSRFIKLGPDHWTSTLLNTLEKEKIDLNIYPNPTTGDITLELQNFTGKEDLSFYLYDVAGKLFLDQKVQNEKNVISLSGLPAGYYLYEIKNHEANKSGKGKLILIK